MRAKFPPKMLTNGPKSSKRKYINEGRLTIKMKGLLQHYRGVCSYPGFTSVDEEEPCDAESFCERAYKRLSKKY